MPVIAGQAVSIAANSVSLNLLAGELFEFPPRPSAITLLAVAAALGVLCTLSIGGTVVANDVPISRANRFPISPDDIVASEGALQGERLFLTFRNSTGAAILIDFQVKITPVA